MQPGLAQLQAWWHGQKPPGLRLSPCPGDSNRTPQGHGPTIAPSAAPLAPTDHTTFPAHSRALVQSCLPKKLQDKLLSLSHPQQRVFQSLGKAQHPLGGVGELLGEGAISLVW